MCARIQSYVCVCVCVRTCLRVRVCAGGGEDDGSCFEWNLFFFLLGEKYRHLQENQSNVILKKKKKKNEKRIKKEMLNTQLS